MLSTRVGPRHIKRHDVAVDVPAVVTAAVGGDELLGDTDKATATASTPVKQDRVATMPLMMTVSCAVGPTVFIWQF